MNVYKPVRIHNLLQSIRLFSDACSSFDVHCASGIRPRKDRIQYFLEESLTLVTALNPHIGYDRAADVAKKAYDESVTLREAAISLSYLSSEQFDAYVAPNKIISSYL